MSNCARRARAFLLALAVAMTSDILAKAQSESDKPVALPTINVTTTQPKPTAAPAKPRAVRMPASRNRSTVTRRAGPSPPSGPPVGGASIAGGPGSGVGTGIGEGALPSQSALSPAASAQPAATTTVGGPTIQRMPVISCGDIFRSLPGFNVSTYGQGAVGYGISLRGYTEAEHGRDIAYIIDNVPINEVSSIHTPNYVDLNILIPETVKSIEIVRGPFWIEAGDSNLGGSVNILTKRLEPFASATGSGGSFSTARGLITYSRTDTAIEPYLVGEGFRTDGYRENSYVNRYDAFNKFTIPFADGSVLSVRGQYYGTDFGAPGYINRDQVLAGVISPRTAVNMTDGGMKELQNLVANYSNGPPDQELSGLAYVVHNHFERYADFGNGQRGQIEDRTQTGGRLRKVATVDAPGWLPTQFLVAGTWRNDSIDALQGPSIARQITSPNLNVGTNETNLAGYGQVQIKPLPILKITAGTRYDHFSYDIDNRIDPTKSPRPEYGIWSPKLGAALAPWPWLSVFANYGQGFRSPEPVLELIERPNQQPFRIWSEEVGVKLTFDYFTLLASRWTTKSENEVFQADAFLPVQTLGRALRDGYDLDARFYLAKDPINQVYLFANYSPVRALLLDAAPSCYVPNVPHYVANVGINSDIATWNGERFSTYAYVTFIGSKHMSQDGFVAVPAYSRVSGKVAYSWPSGWTAFAQSTWYPGDRTAEIAINLGPVTGATSADIFTGPQPGFAFLAGLTYRLPTSPGRNQWLGPGALASR